MIEQALRTPLSKMQGLLFELSGLKGYDSQIFIETFMKSQIAKGLDRDFDFMQWAGKDILWNVWKKNILRGV